MHTVVTAVVRGDDNGVLVTKSFYNAPSVVNGVLDAPEISITHPAVVVAALFVGVYLI